MSAGGFVLPPSSAVGPRRPPGLPAALLPSLGGGGVGRRGGCSLTLTARLGQAQQKGGARRRRGGGGGLNTNQ